MSKGQLRQEKIKEAPTKDAFLQSLRLMTPPYFVLFQTSNEDYFLSITDAVGGGDVYAFKGVDKKGKKHGGCYDFKNKKGWIDRYVKSSGEQEVNQ